MSTSINLAAFTAHVDAYGTWPVFVHDEWVITTENSIWLIRDDKYHRSPRGERGHRESIGGRIADGEWLTYTDAEWEISRFDGEPRLRLRIWPEASPNKADGAFGIVTGLIEEIAGA